MKDIHIRAALKKELSVKYLGDPEALIIDEFGIGNGITRVEVVVISTFLHGFEIKSDYDNLKRLPDQVRLSSSALDHATLVVGSRHIYEAIQVIPYWWGVILVEKGKKDDVNFIDIRKSSSNPSLDKSAIIKLLWRNEALDLLEDTGFADGYHSKPRAVIYERLAETADIDWLRSKIHQQLVSRVGSRSGEEQKPYGG